ncbi:MAG TPA: sensor histidine kinase [Chitinophagaceae bacterium]|nr:sensor histidine kinase [Chitinophagaceae bacterium]
MKPAAGALEKTKPLRDWPVKLLAIPALGIAIPNITGLITHERYTFWEIGASYLFFVFISLVVWQGNVKLMRLVKRRYKWGHRAYYKTILAFFISNVVYSGTVSALLLALWFLSSHEAITDWHPIFYTTLIIVVTANLITNTYENFFLNQEQVNTLSRVEQLSLAKAQAELIALKNQIDPHFMFNSLNTLSYLISSDPQSAKLYNDTLAKVYHYILRNKDKDLVLLREEIEFISNYFYLLKIRFDNSIAMTIEITDVDAEEFLILPISLQTLVENAIKHNEFTENKPLAIDVSVTSSYVLVKNQVHLKTYPVPTSRIGLNNLDNRYKLITGRKILVDNTPGIFTVKLPIINLAV